MGMNAVYAPFEVASESLGDAVRGVRALGISGVNITVPHKIEVIKYLDEVEGIAKELGAVNVIVNENGRLLGCNTDVSGFKIMLEKEGIDIKGEKIAVIGAGGASKSVVKALSMMGASEIYIVNRTYEKALQISGEMSNNETVVRPVSKSDGKIYDIFNICTIIVNTTSLGLKENDELPVRAELISTGHTVIDIIYKPWKTKLLEIAESKGAKVLNGYGMLVYQAIESFRIWTGQVPPLEVIWDAGLEGRV